MNDVSALGFGRLMDVQVREAWQHEAHHLTPWLAANLDRLSEVIGIPLELEDTEVRVENFAADIIARDPMLDRRVLVENQLEVSDHTHLGQILTYLAGLEASVIVWVAPSFREAHLSAIRWLNQHTVEPFAFFAVRLRVVRIGDSPLAPLFDVLERPNDWDRHLQESVRAASTAPSEVVQKRKTFWTHMVDRFPSEAERGPAGAASTRQRSLDPLGAVIVQYLAKESVGLFVRPPRGGTFASLVEKLAPYRAVVEARLGTQLENEFENWLLLSNLKIDTDDRANWDRMADWLHQEADRYEAVLRELLPASAAVDTPPSEMV